MIKGSSVFLEVNDVLPLSTEHSPIGLKISDLAYATSDKSIVNLDCNNAVGISEGQASITATAICNNKQISTSDIITVKKLNYDIAQTRTATGIALARYPKTIEVGEEFSAQAYVLSEITEEHPYPYGYSDDNLVKFSSSNEEVCTVKNGVLKGISKGTVTITVRGVDGIVSETFDVQIVEETSLEYTEDEVWTVNREDYDWTDAETTTLALIDIVAKATTDRMKKVVFPNQIYNVSPDYGTVNIPTQMILDFSGGIIQIEESNLTTSGYQMFLFQDTEYSSIENAIIYGERDLISGTGAESCQSIFFAGYNYKSGLKDCTISKSPGFNIGAMNKGLVRVPFKLTALETGAIDDNGQDMEESYAFRNSGYMNISSIGNQFGFGNMQGYQGYLYLSARCYDIFFYDADYNFISSLKNCIQYYMYDKPTNSVYARIVFRQASAPTSCEADFGGIAHIYSMNRSNKCYIKNCVMEDNYSTAIQPNGGESWLIENCTFKNNGYRDPASHIDWEDGRNNNKGHILRNCTFEGGGAVTAVGADGLAIHNNIFTSVPLTIGSEVQNSRIWLNQFVGSKVTISPKTDEVFSQNYGTDGATYALETVSGVGFAIRECSNSFE